MAAILGWRLSLARPSSQRVVLLHQLLQPFRENVGVDLGRRDIGVAEQGLQAAQISAARQEVGRKGVAQAVG